MEQPADAAWADSFFYVFFEVGGVPGGPLYNHALLRVEAVIDRVPPATTYLHPTGICIPLFTHPTPGQGQETLMRLVEAQHITEITPTPVPTPVGGGAQDLPDMAAAPLEAPDSSGGSGGALAGLIAAVAAGVVALGGAAWYARRRLLR